MVSKVADPCFISSAYQYVILTNSLANNLNTLGMSCLTYD